MFWEFPLSIKCLDTATNGEYERVFETLEDFKTFLKEQFKIPGQYNLKNTKRWKDAGNKYTNSVTRPNFEGGVYTDAPKDSFKEKQFFNSEKEKVKNGIIIDGVFIPGFYYWYLNYCPIYDDVKKKKRFGDVWDSDLWFFQYIMLCLVYGKHACVVKARQRGYSFKIMAILYWSYCWFEGSINTIGASKEDYVLKSWRFLGFYRKHINENTRWSRGPTVPKALSWEEITQTDNNTTVGLDSKLSGTTFKVSPENGVGGSQTFFFYEEAGIAPTLLKTLGFVRPALEKGNRTTGLIICSGAVGELEDAEDIKEVFYNPNAHNFYSLENIWDEDENTGKPCGLFVSEAYNLEGFIDSEGNSLVKEALEFIANAKVDVLKNKRKDLAQLDISQKPTSPKEAFAQRKSSYFDLGLATKQQERIKIKNQENTWIYKPQKGLLEEKDGDVKLVQSDSTEMIYPVKPEIEDKRGVVTIFEPPYQKNPEMYKYFAGVDTVEADDAVGSESLFSIHIFRGRVEVTYEENGVIKKRIEGDKIVAKYFGRFPSVEKTNEQGWLLIKMYNALAYVERSKPNFVNYMLRLGRGAYLAKESDVPVYKDMNSDSQPSGKYGFITTFQNEMWKTLKLYLKEYFLAEYGYVTKSDGEVLKIIRGFDKIDDYWLLEEVIRFIDGKGNYDQLVSAGAAIILAKVFEQNQIGITRISEVKKPEPKQYIPQQPRSLLGNRQQGFFKQTKQRSLLR